MNIASLYQYFPNKEAVVAELQRRHIQDVDRRWPTPSPDVSLEEHLRTVVHTVVAEHRLRPALHRVFAEELPPTVRVGARPGPGDTFWAQHIGPMLSVPDPELAALMARVAGHAIIHEAATTRPELLDHPLFVSELVRLLHGFLSGGSASG